MLAADAGVVGVDAGVLDVGHRMVGAGFWMLGIDCWILGACCLSRVWPSLVIARRHDSETRITCSYRGMQSAKWLSLANVQRELRQASLLPENQLGWLRKCNCFTSV